MSEHTYSDFLATLNDTGQFVAEAVHDHIANHYPEYKPFDIRPLNKTQQEWAANFRKKPKVGKALCSLFSNDGKLFIQVIPLGFMSQELLIKQNDFGDKIRRFMLPVFCIKCKSGCFYEWRQYRLIDNQLRAEARVNCEANRPSAEDAGYYGYGAINIDEDDIKDVLYLIDIMTKHMTKDPKDICGSGYLETSRKRCGSVEIIMLDKMELSVDDFETSHYANPKRLDKYAGVYHLTPMGAYDGLWYYHDDKAVCGEAGDDYCHTTILEGQYASVTIDDPFSFSAWRVWNYIAKWVYENNINIRLVNLGGASVPYFTKFYRQGDDDYMTVYVPIDG